MNPEYIGLQSILTKHLELSGALLPVRFQLHAPDASSVALIGEMTDWQQAPIALQQDPGGLWHTTLRLRQGQWLYKFIVDGRFMADPANPLKADDGLGGHHSYLLVGDGDWCCQTSIDYGQLMRLEMDSQLLRGKLGLHLYLPPGYDRTRAYPLLVLLHGYRTSENQWHSNGMLRQFMGNLLALGLIEPFIVAMPDPVGSDSAEPAAPAIASELLPWLRQIFSVAAGPQFCAVAGMSQYTLSAFALAQRYPDAFGFCAPVSSFYPNLWLDQFARSPQRLAAGLKIYCGTEDYVFARNERFAAILRKNGIRFDYMRINGDHTWHYWNNITRDLLIAVSEFFTGHNELVAAANHHRQPAHE